MWYSLLTTKIVSVTSYFLALRFGEDEQKSVLLNLLTLLWGRGQVTQIVIKCN